MIKAISSNVRRVGAESGGLTHADLRHQSLAEIRRATERADFFRNLISIN